MDEKQAIERMGGTGEVAALCEVSSPTVSNWIRRGIPHPWMMFLRVARPDVPWKKFRSAVIG